MVAAPSSGVATCDQKEKEREREREMELTMSKKRVASLETERKSLLAQLSRLDAHNATLLDHCALLENLLAERKAQKKSDSSRELSVLDLLFSFRERISYASKTLYARKMSQVLPVIFYFIFHFDEWQLTR